MHKKAWQVSFCDWQKIVAYCSGWQPALANHITTWAYPTNPGQAFLCTPVNVLYNKASRQLMIIA